MIEVIGLRKLFGGFAALDGATLDIRQGSITGLIGPNGAGKTTLFNVIAGGLTPTSGQVRLDGHDITGLPPHALFKLGLVRTFQIAREFPTMTVRENLMMVPGGQAGESLWRAVIGGRAIRQQEMVNARRADEVMEFLTLDHLAEDAASTLSGGQRKLLELGRAMMADTRIVLVDEVGAGVNRSLLGKIGDAIRDLNRHHGYTFCMIEHDFDFIARLCDPVIVMAEGKTLATGHAEEIRNDDRVIEAYLGTRSARANPSGRLRPAETRPEVTSADGATPAGGGSADARSISAQHDGTYH